MTFVSSQPILPSKLIDIVSWEPEGHYHYSKMFHCEPEGRFCHWLCTAIAPFWFSTEHLWILIAPFWLSTADVCPTPRMDEYQTSKKLTILICNSLLCTARPAQQTNWYVPHPKNGWVQLMSTLVIKNTDITKSRYNKVIFLIPKFKISLYVIVFATQI